MSSVVVWETSSEQWMSDNHDGETHFFDSEEAAIQSACFQKEWFRNFVKYSYSK